MQNTDDASPATTHTKIQCFPVWAFNTAIQEQTSLSKT